MCATTVCAIYTHDHYTQFSEKIKTNRSFCFLPVPMWQDVSPTPIQLVHIEITQAERPSKGSSLVLKGIRPQVRISIIVGELMWEKIKEIFLTEIHYFTNYKRHASYHRSKTFYMHTLKVWEASAQSLDTGSLVTSLEIERKDLDV